MCGGQGDSSARHSVSHAAFGGWRRIPSGHAEPVRGINEFEVTRWPGNP
jgi:hypothetical protein